jgi:integrase
MKFTEIKDDKGRRWQIDFNCRGHRINRIVYGDRRHAEDEAIRIKADILAGRFIPVKEKGRHQEDGSFSAHADEFLKSYSKQRKKSWTRDEISIENLKDFFAGMNLADVTSRDVERYMAKRSADQDKRVKEPGEETPTISHSTINRELACLKTMLEKAVEWGKLKENPARKVKKFREEKQGERILTADEKEKLIAAASAELRPILTIALNTGMRKGEILNLRWSDVDLVKGYILISRTKSGEPRKVPMNHHVLGVLGGMEQRGEYVFEGEKSGAPVTDVKTSFRGACKRAKIKGLRFHDLRHTAATMMVEGGIDLVTVSRILGHSSIQMTMRYAHPTPENMRLAVQKLGEFFDRGGAKVEPRKIRPSATALKSYN